MALSLIFSLNQVAAEKMAQALAERSCELQLLRQHMLGKEPVGTQSPGARPLKQDKQPIQVRIRHCVSLPEALGLQKELVAAEGNRREKSTTENGRNERGVTKKTSYRRRRTEEQECCLNVLILISSAFVTQCLFLF